MSDNDAYRDFAAEIFAVDPAAVTSDQRDAAKRAIFRLGNSGVPELVAQDMFIPVERLTAAWERVKHRSQPTRGPKSHGS